MAGTRQPNPIRVAWDVLRAQRVPAPAPTGSGGADHEAFGRVLTDLRDSGIDTLPGLRPRLVEYRRSLEPTDPDTLSRGGALAYWLNLYNAGALELAAEAVADGRASVLRVPGAFTRPFATVAGERLSLTEVEHGKIRRFQDPRIHAALVCGSASCPTLRFEPFVHDRISDQLEEQTRYFMEAGGAVLDRSANTLHLSRILLWYSGDFVRPDKMPVWIPASKRSVARHIARWLDEDTAAYVLEARPKIAFRPYDWELACSVA